MFIKEYDCLCENSCKYTSLSVKDRLESEKVSRLIAVHARRANSTELLRGSTPLLIESVPPMNWMWKYKFKKNVMKSESSDELDVE